MGSAATLIGWAPPRDDDGAPAGALPTLASASSKDGLLQLWRPWEPPLRKGGLGNPSQPQRMKPQFYTYLKADAAHPTGEATRPCGLAWLAPDLVVLAFEPGDVVAYRTHTSS